MIENSTELLDNISRNAPWLLNGKENLFPEVRQVEARQFLDILKEDELTIITKTGLVYQNLLLIKIDKDQIKFGRPPEWDECTGSINVFFKNNDGGWSFFLARDVASHPSFLSAKLPDEVYSLQKRHYRRLLAPEGTTAILKNKNSLMETVHVMDISSGGMLICNSSVKDKYPMDLYVNEIFIIVPAKGRNTEAGGTHRVLPFVTKGKVVRSFVDQAAYTSYYGISFLHETPYLARRFDMVVDDFGRMLS